MKVDVVYPLANASKWRNDWELRFSLRSLAEQDWVRDIFVIGHKPEWLRNAIHLPCLDHFKAKDANIINKILLACEDSRLSQDFVINSDDQYILKPIQLDVLLPWLENPSPLVGAQIKQMASLWYKRLLDTMSFCQLANRPQWVFQCHIPYLVSKKKYQEVMGTIPWQRGNGLLTHVYYNILSDHFPIKEPAGMVQRIKFPIRHREWEEIINSGTLFLNHTNKGLGPALLLGMEKLFPKPSRWEKTS